MISANLNRLELHEGWWETSPKHRAKFTFPMFWATGNASTAVLYVELEPGYGNGRHIDTPEELLLILDGEVEVTVGDETQVFTPGGVVLAPALVPHSFRNVGSKTARIVGFFSGNTVVAIFDDPVLPLGRRALGTPTPEVIGRA